MISLFPSMPLVQLGGRRGRAGDGATHRGSHGATAGFRPGSCTWSIKSNSISFGLAAVPLL